MVANLGCRKHILGGEEGADDPEDFWRYTSGEME